MSLGTVQIVLDAPVGGKWRKGELIGDDVVGVNRIGRRSVKIMPMLRLIAAGHARGHVVHRQVQMPTGRRTAGHAVGQHRRGQARSVIGKVPEFAPPGFDLLGLCPAAR